MPSDHDDKLLREAILNIRVKDFSLARRYLELALEMADDRETRTQANYWMSQISSDPVVKRKYLEETVANDPTHPEARKALAILNGKIREGEIVNPDAMVAQPLGIQSAKADRFTCPKCGGRMVFDGDGHTLVCESCTRNQPLNSSVPQFEQDFITAMATGRGHRTPVNVQVFNCRGCGAEFILPAQQISANCTYCGAAHVVAQTRALVEPDSIVPMAFNQGQAALLLKNWFKKHKIKPEGLMPVPVGLYLPVWTFDFLGLVPWSGTVYRDKRKEKVSGEENVNFNDLVVPGVSRLKDLLLKILPGYDTSSALTYDPRYLSGWPAEVYAVAMSDASLDARKQAVERVRRRIESEKSNIEDLNYNTSNISILSFKLVLIPLWYCVYTVEARDFRVIINGQNGAVRGDLSKQGIFSWLEDFFGE